VPLYLKTQTTITIISNKFLEIKRDIHMPKSM
jgi:hypothetical protein